MDAANASHTTSWLIDGLLVCYSLNVIPSEMKFLQDKMFSELLHITALNIAEIDAFLWDKGKQVTVLTKNRWIVKWWDLTLTLCPPNESHKP